MPRIRTIKPEFFQDEKLAPLSVIDRFVFMGLISMADDAGRLLDNVKVIDAFVFPETDDTSAKSLRKLADASRIIRYTAPSGQKLIQIRNWERHQKIDKPNKHTFPAPHPEDVERQTVASFDEDSANDQRALDEDSTTPRRYDLGPTTNDLGSTKGAPKPRADKAAPWMSVIRPIYRERYDADPPSRLVKELRPAVTEHGIDEVARRYAIYCARTEGRFHDGGRFVATWGEWDGETAKIGAARAGPDPAAEWYRMLVTHGLLHAGRDQFRSTVQRLVAEGVIPDETEFIAQCRRVNWPELRNQSAERFAVAYVREHVFNQRSVA